MIACVLEMFPNRAGGSRRDCYYQSVPFQRPVGFQFLSNNILTDSLRSEPSQTGGLQKMEVRFINDLN